MTFVIDVNNNITAHSNDNAPAGAELKLSEHSFGCEKELAALAGTWPGARLIEGGTACRISGRSKIFHNTKKAIARLTDVAIPKALLDHWSGLLCRGDSGWQFHDLDIAEVNLCALRLQA
jgi:hypothetical protein